MVVVQVTRVALLSQLGRWQLGEHLHIREDIHRKRLFTFGHCQNNKDFAHFQNIINFGESDCPLEHSSNRSYSCLLTTYLTMVFDTSPLLSK